MTEPADGGVVVGGPSDAELLADFCQGDEKAFETLYHRYRKLLYGYLNNLCGGNTAEADEVFEETWLRVIHKAPGYRDDGKFSAWLFRISRNIFIDRLRRNRPEMIVEVEVEHVLEDAATEFSPEREAGATDLKRVIAQALAKLPPEQREVFLLREEEELSFREIAEIQQCSLGTVLSRMRYALKSLRSFLTGIDTGGLLR
ncbi:MAG: sigma-70 family RNA polymerase sigma factor [Lentisphaeria bacterium]|nr:sigma-70 family RNA polymerase sigma factor [Lentisphaeria bacterium]